MSDTALVEDTGDVAPPAATRDRAPDGKFTTTKVDAATAPPPAANGTAAGAETGKGRGGTIASGAETVVPPVPQTWPENWRELMAAETGGTDDKAVAKELKRLQRYASPPAVWGKAAELESKFSAGGLIKIPGPKATEEERAAFATAMGVPADAKGYVDKIKLPDGKVLGDADKAVAESFAEALRPHSLTPAQFSAAVDWQLRYEQAKADQAQENDDTHLTQSETELRKEWGGRYKAITHAISSMVDDAPPEVRSFFADARMADGKKAGNNPVLLRWLAEKAADLGYDNAQNYGADGTNPSVNELAALRQKARDKPSEFTKADEARQTQLIAEQQASGKRGRRAA